MTTTTVVERPVAASWSRLRTRLRAYSMLVKGLQTGLLLLTGLAGYVSARSPSAGWLELLFLSLSLGLAISGSTVLNMVYDRGIDRLMQRTARRPLPCGQVEQGQARRVGLLLVLLGVTVAVVQAPLYGLLVFAGFFFDVVVYTIWLKRRTAWSILWGGIAGGMPILAGRALGAGRIDWIGLALALAVLFWIPTHMSTLGIKYAKDYRRAGVPVFANVYGERATRVTIAGSTAAAVVVMLLAMSGIDLGAGYLGTAVGLGGLLLAFTGISVLRHSPRLNFWLYKLASLYMLGSMIVIVVGVLVG